MSIFKDTFIPEVQFQLDARQNSLKKRDVTSIKYLNSRNAWIKMSSSVNVNGTSKLANSYQLKGGILKSDGGLKSGVGGTDNAYSNISPNTSLSLNEREHQRGLRPMPGINSIDIRSKSAYGSLREVVVKFQCWDIKQLEDLELLYMRPGYTVLIEWGWLPYLNLDERGVFKNIEYNTQTFDIIKQTPTKEKIWEELFDKSKKTGGNYDAMFGFVKNYSWSAREDGGYDCSTTIISIGEIIESLKVNYAPLTSKLEIGRNGLLFKNITKDIIKQYKKNILAGLFAEFYDEVFNSNDSKEITNEGKKDKIKDVNNKEYDYFIRKVAIEKNYTDNNKVINSNVNEVSIYIKLNSLVDILNKHVILQDTNRSTTTTTFNQPQLSRSALNPFAPISPSIIIKSTPIVELSVYEREYDKKIDPKNPPPLKPLLCLGHPLQISVDPTICLIGNDIWTNVPDQKETTEGNTGEVIGDIGSNVRIRSFETIFENKNTEYLKNLKPYFKDSDSKELGIIEDIYINLQFLYALSLDNNVESQDKKEKQEISLYDFLKNVMSQVSNCIGNINNFDIHVDPSDNKARIIDINYVDEISKQEAFNNAFTLQMHNLESTVRSYKLESQIFQEQSTIIAIGAQVQGGALGTDSNTMNGFNRGITDRIIPRKEDPTTIQEDKEKAKTEQLQNLKDNLSTIYDFFGDKTSSFVFWSKASYDTARAGEYKGALRDLINGFKSFTDIKSKYNAIIPTKLSITMDGIGGLVIGHIFKIPDNLLPKGYKGDGLCSKLGHIVTGIGHSILNNDWVTNIDAQTIILDDPEKGIDGKEVSLLDFKKILRTPISRINLINDTFSVLIPSVTNISIGSVNEDSKKYPVLINNNLYKSEYNSLVQKEIIIIPNNPVANSLRKLLDKNYIVEKNNNLSSNGDITEALKTSILTFQNKIKGNKTGFNFVTSKTPIVITAGNDTYHRTYGEQRNRTPHCRGLAVDISNQNLSDIQIQSIMVALKESGFTYVIYHLGTSFHIHANINPN